MLRRKLAGRDVPIVGIGTWQMESDDRADAIAAIRRALDLGMTHVDTAEMYGDGVVEELVAEAIRGRRDEVFLVSKVLPENASREDTIRACERSLAHLHTDHLDCYLLHWRESIPLEETISAFESLREAGKIVAWGVSNFDVRDLDDALAIAGPGKIACNQVLYHLKQRAIERRVLPWCERHDVPVIAYSPFGSGDFPSTDPTLERVAKSHAVTPRAIALAFLARHTFVIPKSTNPSHVAQNAAAGDLSLSPEDITAIDQSFPRGRTPRVLPTI